MFMTTVGKRSNKKGLFGRNCQYGLVLQSCTKMNIKSEQKTLMKVRQIKYRENEFLKNPILVPLNPSYYNQSLKFFVFLFMGHLSKLNQQAASSVIFQCEARMGQLVKLLIISRYRQQLHRKGPLDRYTTNQRKETQDRAAARPLPTNTCPVHHVKSLSSLSLKELN